MTKIDIFSGFLGAGKTTLIKKLIKEAFAGQQVVLIENEFGEIGIDGGFLKESGIQINELNAGCICCSLVGDFRAALQQVVEQYHPDRIVIEPSGVGKLSDVTRAVEGVAEHLDVQLNSFVTVADVNKVKMYMKNFGEFYENGVCSCGHHHHDDDDDEDEHEHHHHDHDEDDDHEEHCCCGHHHHDDDDDEDEHEHHHEHGGHCCCGHHHHHHDHDADEGFASWGVETARKFTKAEVEHALTELDTGNYGMILRSKGIVDGGADGWLEFDYVPGEWEVRARGADVGGKLVVIGSKLNEKAIAELFGC